MVVRINRKNFRVFAFDVESHNDDESIAKKETSIWLYSFIDENSTADDENSYGYTIEQFLERLEEESRIDTHNRRPPNLYIAVYNLSFEWSFLLPVMLSRGFKWKPGIDPKKDDGLLFNSVSNTSCASVWEGTLYFGKKHGLIKFRDIGKIYKGGLRNVAKHFGLKTQKGDIDYRLNRLHGHTVTKEEKVYCFKDTRILIEICQRMIQDGDTLFFKSLSAASYAAATMIKAGFPNCYKPIEAFRKRYPILPEEVDEFIRQGTGGGICYVPPRWQFKQIGAQIHIDMHQAHPTSGYLNYFPKGNPIYFKGRPPRGKISICHIKISYSWVKLHSVIKLIGKEFAFDEDLYVWTIEIPTILKCYQHCKIEYIDGYAFDVARLPWRRFYEDNYKARAKAKKEGDALEAERRKLLNNSSYGKLLEHGHTEELENVIRLDGVITSVKHEAENPSHEAKYTYLPIGSCIPAYTRVRLIETALLFGYENITYFDTDSIFVLDTPETRKALKKVNMADQLGGWGMENDITRSQFAAPKRYKLQEIGARGRNFLLLNNVIKAAGFNFHDEDFETVDIVEGDYDIQGVEKVKGGTLVIFKTREMKIQPKYSQIYKENVELIRR